MKLRIEPDTDAQSPAEWGNEDLFLIANHRDFFVPPSKSERRFDVQDVIERHEDTHHVFALEAYIHSGVRLALAGEGNFPDRQWDVSRLGVVFAAKSEWKTMAKARDAALSLVNEWNQYLSGDVWGYVVEDDEGNHLESCWGFYGREYCEQEGRSLLEHCEANDTTAACMI